MKTLLTIVFIVVGIASALAQDSKEAGTLPRPEPLYILDGQEIKKEHVDSLVNRLDADKIHTVEVLKDAASVEKYGDRARNGVVKITTKDGRKPDEE